MKKQDRTCLDCFELKAKIPVENGKILYAEATARCVKGWLERSEGKDQVFKNVLYGRLKPRKAFDQAKRCDYFNG